MKYFIGFIIGICGTIATFSAAEHINVLNPITWNNARYTLPALDYKSVQPIPKKTLTFDFIIDKEGVPRNIKMLQGLDEIARKRIETQRYSPALDKETNEPVDVWWVSIVDVCAEYAMTNPKR